MKYPTKHEVRLAHDPELRFTDKSTPVTNVNAYLYGGKDREKRDQDSMIRITFWGPLAKKVYSSCKSGTGLIIEGYQAPPYENEGNDGKKYINLDFTAWEASISKRETTEVPLPDLEVEANIEAAAKVKADKK